MLLFLKAFRRQDDTESMEPQWAIYEQALRASLCDLGASPDEIEHVIASIKPVYLVAAKPTRLSGDPKRLLDEMNQYVWQQVSYLLMALVRDEIALYRLSRSRQ